MIRKDRPNRKGGGCVLYYTEHLRVVHRKDLGVKDLEAIWIEVKFPPSTSALFSVVYRPPDNRVFFHLLNTTLEKAWMISENIFLLGVFPIS